ncbi:MAG: hypothetical protein VB089_18210 [Anaerolineaceae bacterium]|nr:hypothetical protein [Anaerolineaceae bacterium]
MQTCSRCSANSPDSALLCVQCHADLKDFSTTAVALKNFRENKRVTGVRISVDANCCPACREAQGAYSLDDVPTLPIPGCSHTNGCRCFYDPILNQIYP